LGKAQLFVISYLLKDSVLGTDSPFERDASTGDAVDSNKKILNFFVLPNTLLTLMNFPAASHGVSVKDKFNPNAASCGELNPADFAISTSHSL